MMHAFLVISLQKKIMSCGILIMFSFIALPAFGQSQTQWNGTISESDRQIFCGTAQIGEWEKDLLGYSNQNAEIDDIAGAFRTVRCSIAHGTSIEYTGSMLHAAVRRNPNSQNIARGIVNLLIRDDPTQRNREIFIELILGFEADRDLFSELRDTWNKDISRRDSTFNIARHICLSIDRFDIVELRAVRATDCKHAPFDIPARDE